MSLRKWASKYVYGGDDAAETPETATPTPVTPIGATPDPTGGVAVPATPPVGTPVQVVPRDNSLSGIPQEFIEHVEKVFTERNLPGPDFYEFFQAIEGMDDMPIDEQTKYRMAFKSLSTVGVTKETLLTTKDHYIQSVMEQLEGYKQAVQTKQAEAQAKVVQAEKERAEIVKQMNELQKRLDSINEVVATEQRNSEQFPAKIQAFTRTVEVFTHSIQDVASKISAHIQ